MVMVVREKERSIMKAIELGVRTVLHLFLIAALAIGCVRFLTGCTLIEKANSDGKIVEVLKETYANGNAPQKTLAFSVIRREGRVATAKPPARARERRRSPTRSSNSSRKMRRKIANAIWRGGRR